MPLTHNRIAFTAVAIVMSVGNGVGAGIVMTSAADASPLDCRLGFLGIWRTLSDSGNAAGPAKVAAVTSATTLAAGISASGVLGVLTAIGLLLWVPGSGGKVPNL